MHLNADVQSRGSATSIIVVVITLPITVAIDIGVGIDLLIFSPHHCEGFCF